MKITEEELKRFQEELRNVNNHIDNELHILRDWISDSQELHTRIDMMIYVLGEVATPGREGPS